MYILLIADDVVSKKKTDDGIGPSIVTQRRSEGLSRWGTRCFAALSMTMLPLLLLRLGVILSAAKHLACWTEMLRYTQHDSAPPDCRA